MSLYEVWANLKRMSEVPGGEENFFGGLLAGGNQATITRAMAPLAGLRPVVRYLEFRWEWEG